MGTAAGGQGSARGAAGGQGSARGEAVWYLATKSSIGYGLTFMRFFCAACLLIAVHLWPQTSAHNLISARCRCRSFKLAASQWHFRPEKCWACECNICTSEELGVTELACSICLCACVFAIVCLCACVFAIVRKLQYACRYLWCICAKERGTGKALQQAWWY